jgi:hypothetical protein
MLAVKSGRSGVRELAEQGCARRGDASATAARAAAPFARENGSLVPKFDLTVGDSNDRVPASAEIERLKGMQPRAMSREQSVCVVLLYKRLQLEWALELSKHPDRKPPPGRFQQRVAELLSCSTATVARAYKEFNERRAFTEARIPGNYSAKTTRLADTAEVLHTVRMYVNDCRAKQRLVTGKPVLEHLVETGHLTVDLGSRKAQQSALRVVQRYLRAHGF